MKIQGKIRIAIFCHALGHLKNSIFSSKTYICTSWPRVVLRDCTKNVNIFYCESILEFFLLMGKFFDDVDAWGVTFVNSGHS